MKSSWPNLKPFITIIMTFALVILLFVPFTINKEVLLLFSTSYGAIITYFFKEYKE